MKNHPLLFGSNPRRTAGRALLIVAGAAIVFAFVLKPVRLVGISMEPTYADGGLNFANRLAFSWRDPARGDVVAIRMAGPSVLYVKRIVGLPRERVEIEKGTVKINGRALSEPAVVRKSPWNMPPLTLGADEYFVVGDNREMSIHDHDLGRTTRNRIIGKLLF